LCQVTLKLAETSVVKSRLSVSYRANLFLNFAPNHIFGVVETGHFKCCALTDTVTEVY